MPSAWQRTFPFQPTRPLRGATTCGEPVAIVEVISTHAPLAGRDAMARPGFTL